MSDQIANFSRVFLGDQNGTDVPGHLRMNQMGFAFRESGNDQKITKVPAENLESLSFLRAAREYQLRAQMKNGAVYKFDGFENEDFNTIQRYAKQYFNVPIERKELSLRGWNWGQANVRNNYISFDVGNKLNFELPLRDVSNVTAPSKTEVSVEMHEPKNSGGSKGVNKDDMLLEIRFYIPGSAVADNADSEIEVKEEKIKVEAVQSDSSEHSSALLDEDGDEITAASVFYENVKELADIGVVSGEALCSFSDLLCLTPRGRFTLDIYQTCLRLRGKSHDYKISYETISRFFSLPKLDDIHQFIVIGLDPPLRQGQTRYPFLVFQLAHDYEIEVELNSDPEKLKTLFNGQLKSSYDSPIHAVLEQVLGAVTGKPAVVPSTDFQSAQGLQGIKCSIKTNEATLYPLDKAFLIIPKPPTLIMHGDISNVVVSRVAGGVASISRTFEMTFHMRVGADFTFNNISREEYAGLAKFLFSKNIRVKSELDDSGATRLAELGSDADDVSIASSNDASKQHKRKAGPVVDDEDESEDEDFVAESSDSDVAEEYSENGSSSDEDDSDSDESSSEPESKATTKQGSSKHGSQAAKKQKVSPSKNQLSNEYVNSDSDS